MADLTQYYVDIKAKKAELAAAFPKGFCFIMSVYNRDRGSKPGTVTEVSVPNAAQFIVEGTHRLASPKEAHEFHIEMERKRKENSDQERARARRHFVNMLGGDIPLPAESLIAQPVEADKTSEK